jgi:putative membrane-bound dehydrogenase-like protein
MHPDTPARVWCLAVWCIASCAASGVDDQLRIGVAKVDITPDHAVRLSGYGNRRTESEGVAQKLWAKAVAIQQEDQAPALIVTVDNLGVPVWIRDELVKRLSNKIKGFDSKRFAICASHTHSAPCLTGIVSNLFSMDLTTNEWANIDRYTQKLVNDMERVSLAAMKDLQPGQLHWGQGRVSFAKNRRTQGGPVDHALPVLKVTDAKGKLRAVLANYACHCTTLGGEFNQVHGDWAGYAQEYIERDHPGAIALVSVSCGADANPFPRGKLDHAKQHGEELAAEVKELLDQRLTPLTSEMTFRTRQIELAFDPLPTREQWVQRAKESGIVGYHAKKNLARLDRGETLPTRIPYMVQVWTFGNELAMVFLPGEVVVDYALRLKRELDEKRLWVNAYANDVPCYIPSRRVLKEGGYEAESSLWYYDRPARLAPENEDLIVKTVHELVPDSFNVKDAERPDPLSPEHALRTFRIKPGLTIELAAAEPLVQSPVAIDWDPEGRLWVVEMFDYPAGVDGDWKPGGRVKVLTDSDRDGRYDRASVFLNSLPFPTGLMVTPKGVLVCAAPDILLAQDTNGDGKADVLRTNYTGFATHNYQARVNGFAWGLDGWIHGSSGLFGGKIKNLVTGKEVDLSGRDFRINLATWEIEPVAGITQQGRIRDDWGNWFGNDNSTLLWQFPLSDHCARRNPHVVYPSPRVNVAKRADANKVFPISRTLERFNDPQMANRVTSACGPEIYRDTFLGDEFYGSAFVCEPVHNLVTRLLLERDGVTFAARRADDELNREFLASSDNWFRPVQVRTGPDGALWVVDMYRFVIEHPRWIPPDRLKKLDVRAGAEMGRIYRVVSKVKSPRKFEFALNSPNGPARDMAQHWSQPKGSELFLRSSNPAVRVQCLAVGVSPRILAEAYTDPHPAVRAEAIRVTKTFSDLEKALPALVNDPDESVRFQLALSLGDWDTSAASEALVKLAGDGWMQAAILSSARFHLGALLGLTNESLFLPLVQSAIGFGAKEELVDHLTKRETLEPKLIATLLDAIPNWRQWFGNPRIVTTIERELKMARERTDAAHIPLLGRDKSTRESDINLLITFLSKGDALASGALDRLAKIDHEQVATAVLKQWQTFSPGLRPRLVALLSGRTLWIDKLLAALESGLISPLEIALEQRQRLRKDKRFAELLPEPAQRTEVLARYKNLDSLAPNASRGAQLFDQHCATCHFHRGRGNAVGPPLAEFAGKSADDFVLAIFDPNAAVDPKHVTYSVELRDGRSFTGLVKDETATSFVLVQGGGLRETILRSEVTEMRASKLSLMPEGLEQALTPQDTADLIAWIKEAGSESVGQAKLKPQQNVARP